MLHRVLLLFLPALVAVATPIAAESQENALFFVGHTSNCPQFTKPVGEGYCKSFVSNRFIGASPNGSCPANSSPVGEGYCMYPPGW